MSLTKEEELKIAKKIRQKLEYWKKHDQEKYREAVRAIKMAEGEIV